MVLRRIALTIWFGFMAAVLIGVAMSRAVDHDEHSFIAAGVLLARDGLLPYRDYPYFHLPTLVFVYAAIFKTTNHLLLGARGFNVAAALALLIVVFCMSMRALREKEYYWRLGVSMAVTLLLFTNPLFRYTEGLAWNHDFPVLLSVLTFACVCSYSQGVGRKVMVFFAGMLLGGAVSSRLTFAPLIAPFLGMIFLGSNRSGDKRWPAAVLFSAGLLVALLPTLLLFWMNPHRFLFDNFSYHHTLNTSYQIAKAQKETVNKPLPFPYGRLISRYTGRMWLILTFSYLVIWKKLISWNWRGDGDRRLRFVLVLIPFAFIGSFVPTPSFKQYYYDLVPFLILGIIYSLATTEPRLLRRYLLTFLGVFLVCCAFSGFDFKYLTAFRTADQWPPLVVHSMGLDMKKAVGNGKILTLSPLFPLEGGLQIYKAFATGPFAWRTAGFVAKNEKEELGFVDAEDLSQLLDCERPAGVLLGGESEELERPFSEFAEKNGYTLHQRIHDYSINSRIRDYDLWMPAIR